MISQDDYALRVKQIQNLQYERAKVYPFRDQVYKDLLETTDKFSEDIVSSVDFGNLYTQTEKELIYSINPWIESPIFICGHMKSGTTLMVRLLDGHPNIFAMPGDSHFVNNYNKWQNDEFMDIAKHWMNILINTTGQEPFWFIGTEKKTFESFLIYLKYFLNKGDNIFISVLSAIYAANPKRSEAVQHWVEKTPNNEAHVSFLTEKYPKAKFIHIVRDTYDNCAALKKLSIYRGNTFNASATASSIKYNYELAIHNKSKLGLSRYFIVRYEDLVSDPKKQLNKICEFLNISFHDILLIPTENSTQCVSNSMFSERRCTGIILNKLGEKSNLSVLSAEEIEAISKTINPIPSPKFDIKGLLGIIRRRNRGNI